MKFWFDTEFIEDGRTIDLISIGIVAEDDRTYYAISKEFDASKASDWVTENVLKHLPPVTHRAVPMGPNVRGMHFIPEYPPEYKMRSEIRDEVLAFIGQDDPQIWAYYADYDWVALCQLFGRMVDLPKGWPMYCRDVKQLINKSIKAVQPQIEHHALYDAIATRDTHRLYNNFILGDYRA